jgi:hypothetical protein
MNKLIFSVWLLCVSLALRAEDPPSFTTTHFPGEEDRQFLFPTPQAERYYTEAFLALKIEAVYVDGAALVAEPHESTLKQHIEGRIFRPVLPTRMMYRLDSRQFISVTSRDKTGGMNLVSYTIPIDASKIEITYRIRFPDGKVSGPMQVVSLSAYDFKKVDDK